MAGKTIEQVEQEAAQYLKTCRTTKVVSEKESAFGKVLSLAEQYAYVSIPGLGGPRLAAKRGHLREVLKSIERFEAKRAAGNPAVGGRLRELQAEARVLTGSIRREESAIMAAIEGDEA
jgi:hypothetical protein